MEVVGASILLGGIIIIALPKNFDKLANNGCVRNGGAKDYLQEIEALKQQTIEEQQAKLLKEEKVNKAKEAKAKKQRLKRLQAAGVDVGGLRSMLEEAKREDNESSGFERFLIGSFSALLVVAFCLVVFIVLNNIVDVDSLFAREIRVLKGNVT